ncbi:hypothetical protein [Prescottella equi]
MIGSRRETWSEDLPAPDSLVLANRPLRPGVDPGELSRFADDRWQLGHGVFEAHAGALSVDLVSIDPAFREPLRRLIWILINHDGTGIMATAVPARVLALHTIANEARFYRAFTDWLITRGRGAFVEVTGHDLDDYLVHVKMAEITHSAQEDLLAAVIRIWTYRTLMPETDRLPASPPWNGDRIKHLLERARTRDGIRTPRIHPDTISSLLAWSLRFVEDFAPDVSAGFHEHERLHTRTYMGRHRRSGRYRRTPGELPDDLRGLLRAYSRLGYPLPGYRNQAGELTYHFSYLARLLDTDAAALRLPACMTVLNECPLPVREGAPLLIPVTGILEGRPWLPQPIDHSEARELARHLSAACFVVIAYLSGMRTGEVLSLERGCLDHDPATGLILLRGHHWKGVCDQTGAKLPQGQQREDPWVVAEPVATAISVLEHLHSEQLLFPHMLGERNPEPASGARQFRVGRARTSTKINDDITAMISWVDAYCERTGRADPIPPDPISSQITGRRLRRTLAWFIARKPRGLVAAAIQYGHLQVQMTLGYAGTYASGFPDDLAFEEWLTRLELLADAHTRLEAGEHVSGPAADVYRQRVYAATRFAGRTLRTNREARTLLANPDLQIYSGSGMTCVLDPQRAACRLGADDSNTRRTPDLTDCRPHCVNIARTDRDIDQLRRQHEQLRVIVDDPFAPPIRHERERHQLERLERLIDEHDQQTGAR